MVKVKIYYDDGTNIIRTFVSEKQAQWFIHMEGDHVQKVEYL